MKLIDFSSKLPRHYLDALENLFFFNENQSDFMKTIEKSIERFGAPKIVIEGKYLRFKIGSLNNVQCLFAFDCKAEDANLIGLIIYFRNTINNMTILHIAIDEDYTISGRFSNQMLAVKLINKVKEIALKIKGVEILSIAYKGDFEEMITFPIRETK
jgi:hypothetical protein